MPHTDTPNGTTSDRLTPWLIVGLWTVPALLSTFETVTFGRLGGRPIAWSAAFLAEAPQWYGWALLTPVILSLGARFPLALPPRWRNVIVHAAAALTFSYLVAMADAAANIWLRPTTTAFFPLTRNWFLSGLPATTLAYIAIILLSYVLGGAARLRERDRQLREAQLGALRAQLQPHFLFNSLNAIMALVRDKETDQAVQALSLLSDVLRATINSGDAITTTLGQELDFVSRYLEIERMRFGDRLRVTMDVSQALLDTPVPTFVLQPFVENALKHGMLRDRKGNGITIGATQTDRALLLTVRDDGRGLAGEMTGGVGIANARARLEHMYGGRAELAVRNVDPGVEVTIRLPLA